MLRCTMMVLLLAAMLLAGGCVNIDLSGIPGIAQAVEGVRPQSRQQDEPPPPRLLLTDTPGR
ncbi:MAG: hypothetical protein GVY16_09515 [Planctomycetes bacterium]|nr:hypothetical protein [Planctomycetota bacterium]